MTAVLYSRVSSEEQARQGVSLDDQLRRLTGFRSDAQSFVDEGVSTKIPLAKRPAGSLLVASVESRQTKLVVITRLDRLFRDAVEAMTTAMHWQKMGVSLVVLETSQGPVDTRSAGGWMQFQMLCVFAEFERNMIRDRTKSAMQHLRTVNPDGWTSRKSGRFVEQFGNPRRYRHGEALEWAQRLHREGLTHADIADKMNADPEAPRPARGERWTVRAVATMLWRAK